jgi:hypothetical protein
MLNRLQNDVIYKGVITIMKKNILYIAIIGIIFSINIFAQQKWDGTWKVEYRNSASTLDITTVSKSKIKFSISAFSGTHDAEISGTAVVTGANATFRDKDCKLTFRLNKNELKLSENGCEGYGGTGVGFAGDYSKGKAKKRIENFVTYEVFPNVSLDKKFKNLVGKDYEMFLNSFHIYGEDENADTFAAKVFSGCIRGVCPYNAAIIMFDENENFWSAVIEAGDDGNADVRYYTNSNDWKTKLPKTIENWVNEKKEFSDKLKVVYM